MNRTEAPNRMGLFEGKAKAVRCFNFIKQVYLQKSQHDRV